MNIEYIFHLIANLLLLFEKSMQLPNIFNGVLDREPFVINGGLSRGFPLAYLVFVRVVMLKLGRIVGGVLSIVSA